MPPDAVAPLVPLFAGTTQAYTTVLVSNATAATLVTATVAVAGDTIGVVAAANGGPASACATAPVTCPLAVGTNLITVTVTAADGAPRAYTIGVPRAPSAGPPGGGVSG